MNKNIEQYVLQFGSVCRGHQSEESLSYPYGDLSSSDWAAATTIVKYAHFDYVEAFKLYLSAAVELFSPDAEYTVSAIASALPTSVVALDLQTESLCLRIEFNLVCDCGFGLRLLACSEDAKVSDYSVIVDGERAKQLIESILDVAGLPRDTDDQITRAQVALIIAYVVCTAASVDSVEDYRKDVLDYLDVADPEDDYLVWDDREYEDGTTFAQTLAWAQYISASRAPKGINKHAYMKDVQTLVEAADALFDLNTAIQDVAAESERLRKYIKKFFHDKKRAIPINDLYIGEPYYGAKYEDLVNNADIDDSHWAVEDWAFAVLELINAIEETRNARSQNGA